MTEPRVRTSDYGVVADNDPRLVPVPSTGTPQKLHWYAAKALTELSAAARSAGHDIRVASGWRPHRWRNRKHYEQVLLERYGSIAKGKRYLAFNSPHETGLAFDIGTGGLSPTSATISIQRQTPLYKWLAANAGSYGITPYSAEPWHWEVRAPLSVWEQVVRRQVLWLAVVATTGAVVGIGWLMTPKGREALRKAKMKWRGLTRKRLRS